MNIAMSMLCLMLFIVHAQAQDSDTPPPKERIDPSTVMTIVKACVGIYNFFKAKEFTCQVGMESDLSTVRCLPQQESCVTANVTVGIYTFIYKNCASDLDCVFKERIRKMVLNDVVDAFEDTRGCILNSYDCNSAPHGGPPRFLALLIPPIISLLVFSS
ncbi:uncharacterized protein LOC144720616 isoform X2 [Lampetra planeri]